MKAVVVFYSQTCGNTRKIAEMIALTTGAALAEIETVEDYGRDYDAVMVRARDEINSGFLPEHCLHIAMNAAERRYVIWNPELRADVIYGDTEYPDFPLPRLVFSLRVLSDGKVADCSMGVVADETPTENTPMYFYPFSNVYDDERVCTGNNVLPRYRKLTAIKNFPRYLLGLPDNDDMFTSAHNRLGLDHKALLEHLKDKDPAYYYSDILVPNRRTLGDFITRRL